MPQGEQAMAELHDTQGQNGLQEPMVTALMAALQASEDKTMVAVRFYEVMTRSSHIDM
jgi:hypothetical protein